MLQKYSILPVERFFDCVPNGNIGETNPRRPRTCNRTIGTDQIFMEVPARRARFAQFSRDSAANRMGFGAHNFFFRSKWKIDAIATLAKALDLSFAARLLAAEVIRRHTLRHDATRPIEPPQRLEICVLRRDPAF